MTLDPKRPIAVGQLRQWQGLPTVFGGQPAEAEGLVFRVVRMDDDEDANVYGEYEPRDPAIFTSATTAYMQKHSIALEAPAPSPLHFLVQSNMYAAKELERIVAALRAASVRYSLHKIMPFTHELQPEFEATGPVIALGTFTVGEIARARGWFPGFYNNENFNAVEVAKHWPVLNDDAQVYAFGDVPEQVGVFHIRPVDDGKLFPGQLMNWSWFVEWRQQQLSLGAEGVATLQTPVMVSQPKYIEFEARVWIVDGRPVAASIYRRNGRLSYESNVDPAVIEFAQSLAAAWRSARAFCIDIVGTGDALKVLELTTINAAGLYAANVEAIVAALAAAPT